MKKFDNQKGITGLAAIVFVIAIGVVAGYFINNRPIAEQDLKSLVGKQLLVDHVSNFDSLTISDLPGVGEYSTVYDYNGNKIFAGGKVVEYDLETGSYVRMEDTELVNCGSRSEIIGDFLYAMCEREQKFPDDRSISFGQVFKVDLESGKVVKEYFDNFQDVTEDPPHTDLYYLESVSRTGRLTNSLLVLKDNMLWVSSWDGVARINTDTDEIEKYDNEAIFGNECHPSRVFNDGGTIAVIASNNAHTCPYGGVSHFVEADNKWDQVIPGFGTDFEGALKEEHEYIREHGLFELVKSEINIPMYYYISPLRNEMYHLVASDGIYTLKKDEFPEKLFEQNIPEPELGYVKKEFYTEGDRYFILVTLRSSGGGHSEIVYRAYGYIIDFDNQVFKELGVGNQVSQERLEEISTQIGDAIFSQDGDLVSITSSSGEETLATIDFAKAELLIEQ